MTTSAKLANELNTALSGNAWYGPNIYSIIEHVSFEAAYEKPPGSVHNIAGILVHMIAWTEEVMDRMNGKPASDPNSGDWPETGSPDEQKWQNYVNDFKLVNVNLTGLINSFAEERWNDPVDDGRDNPETSFAETIEGLIQHHVYHSGQIALLTRIINGR